jgi:hypothetical protein
MHAACPAFLVILTWLYYMQTEYSYCASLSHLIHSTLEVGKSMFLPHTHTHTHTHTQASRNGLLWMYAVELKE